MPVRLGSVTMTTESCKNDATTLSRKNFSEYALRRSCDYYLVECLLMYAV